LIFSKDSDVTLVVTSCGRFDLLTQTLASFDTFNSMPIREVLITEDSGDKSVEKCIPEHWRAHTRFGSHKPEWQGFSFNPGLRRLADYQQHAPYSSHGGEKNLSRLFASENRYALILESDAVLHTGFGEHVEVPEEKANKLRRKRRDRVKLLGTFIIGLIVGWILSVIG